MKNMYDVWVMDLDNMDPNKEDTAEHYMIAAKSMSAAIAKVEEAYEDPEKGPERHFIIWAETKFNGEELPRDMYEIWDADHMRGEDMADLMEASHSFLFKALTEKKARQAYNRATLGHEQDADCAPTKMVEDAVRWSAQEIENGFQQLQKFTDNPYQE